MALSVFGVVVFDRLTEQFYNLPWVHNFDLPEWYHLIHGGVMGIMVPSTYLLLRATNKKLLRMSAIWIASPLVALLTLKITLIVDPLRFLS